MNNKHIVGKRVSSFELYDELGPITGIALLLDDENELIAGDDTGYMLEVSCPFGTQAMAEDLLAKMQGKTYQGYRAQNAILDPTAELGDGITVNGIYSMLAHRVVTFGPGHMSEISAPGESTMEHEFSWKSPEKKEFDRKLAATRSLIEKTAEQVRISVEGMEGQVAAFSVSLDSISAEMQGLEGEYAALALTLEGLTVSGPSGTTLIAGNMIDTSTLNVDNINIDLTGSIKWTDLSEAVQDEIDTALGYADEALAAAEDAAETVSGWAYMGGTYIDGAMIKAGTVMASKLIGGEVALLTSAEREAGGLSITGASTSTYAIELYSNGALRMEAYNGAAYIGAGDAYVHVEEGGATINNGSVGISLDTHVWVSSGLYPTRANAYQCGNANYPWSAVWSTNGMCETSARDKKKNIEYGLEHMDGFFDDLLPGSYQMVNGTSGRRHNGFIADDVLDNLVKHGIPTKDFGGYVEDKDEAGNPVYALRYSEFIPLLVDQVQKLKTRVAQLEGKKYEV